MRNSPNPPKQKSAASEAERHASRNLLHANLGVRAARPISETARFGFNGRHSDERGASAGNARPARMRWRVAATNERSNRIAFAIAALLSALFIAGLVLLALSHRGADPSSVRPQLSKPYSEDSDG